METSGMNAEQIMANHGLTVLLTADYHAILAELALLKREERLCRDGAEEHF